MPKYSTGTEYAVGGPSTLEALKYLAIRGVNLPIICFRDEERAKEFASSIDGGLSGEVILSEYHPFSDLGFPHEVKVSKNREAKNA